MLPIFVLLTFPVPWQWGCWASSFATLSDQPPLTWCTVLTFARDDGYYMATWS